MAIRKTSRWPGLDEQLLQVLWLHHDGLDISAVYDAFEKSNRIPSEMHVPIPRGEAYAELAREGVNWRELSHDSLRSEWNTEPKWKNEIRFARDRLNKRLFLDATARKGLWRLSQAGQLHARQVFGDPTAASKRLATLEELERRMVSAGEFSDAAERLADRLDRSILLRRGQPAFRQALLQAYDGKCAISGCDVVDALEAAHVVPASAGGSTHIGNGILLRADLHTLFDLDLIGLNPSTHHVELATSLTGSAYHDLAGRAFRPKQLDQSPHQENLERRWRMYLDARECQLGVRSGLN